MIAVDGLHKAFGKAREVRAVRGVTFDAPDGEITGLLGPNGAGKTTLLRIIATLVVPDAGRASVGGLDVVAARYAVRRRIGVLTDARGLYPRLTARENVRYFGALHGLSGAALEVRIDRLLATLGLTTLADRRAGGVSPGEPQEVAYAPARVLDIMSVRALRGELRRCVRRANACCSRRT